MPKTLVADSAAVLSSVAGSTAAVDHPDLVPWMERALSRQATSMAALESANAERSTDVREAIHEAARRLLPPRDREIIPKARWRGVVFRWLQVHHQLVGLGSAPCRRVVKRAMAEWIPPTGGRIWGVKNGVKFDHREG